MPNRGEQRGLATRPWDLALELIDALVARATAAGDEQRETEARDECRRLEGHTTSA